MGFLTLRRFAPACGCPSVSRPSIASCARPVRGLVGAVAATSASGRPGPRVVGRSSTPDGIGRGIDRPDREFVARGDRSRICDSASGLRSRLRSVPATVRLLQRADPALGFRRGPSQGVARRCASSRVVVSALATRTLSQSVACRAASPRVARGRPRPGRVRRSSERTRHSPGTSAAQTVARGASSVCEGMSGPAASNTDDLLPSPTARGTF